MVCPARALFFYMYNSAIVMFVSASLGNTILAFCLGGQVINLSQLVPRWWPGTCCLAGCPVMTDLMTSCQQSYPTHLLDSHFQRRVSQKKVSLFLPHSLPIAKNNLFHFPYPTSPAGPSPIVWNQESEDLETYYPDYLKGSHTWPAIL